MEIEGEDGSTILLDEGSKRLFGRGFGLNSDDRNVSRRHLLLELRNGDDRTGPSVCFQALGKNPVWVRDSSSGKIRVFRSSEKGSIASGDGFCVSAKRPVWFTLNRREREADEERGERPLENQNGVAESEGFAKGDEDFGIESLDVSEIDPVKEFGFLVMGHEFDHYPKQMILDIENWDWFLEEPSGKNRDDEVFEKERKRASGKVKRVGRFSSDDDDDDDDWSGEDENDKQLLTKLRRVSTPSYSTRSRDRSRTHKGQRTSKTSYGNKMSGTARDDEDDDTLGGFIVKDEVEPEEEIGGDEEEQEDDFEDDDEEENA